MVMRSVTGLLGLVLTINKVVGAGRTGMAELSVFIIIKSELSPVHHCHRNQIER